MKTTPDSRKSSKQPQPEMITFTQSGGFAGVRKGCHVPLVDLPPRIQARLKEVRRLKNKDVGSSPPRDRILYQLRFQGGRGSPVVRLDDLTLPEKVRPLIVFLSAHSRPLPPETSTEA
jgi:hypothetical protein